MTAKDQYSLLMVIFFAIAAIASCVGAWWMHRVFGCFVIFEASEPYGWSELMTACKTSSQQIINTHP